LRQAYTVCIVIGVSLPLISLVFGQIFGLFSDLFDGLSGIFDGFHFSFDINIGDINICFLPVSVQSVCAGLLLFGSVGKLVFNGGNYVVANIAATAAGYAAALAIQTFINRLKKIEHRPPSKEELMFCETKVVNKILAGGYGSVSVRTEQGSINYPAKSLDPIEEIRQNTFVYIIRFDRNVAVVKKANFSGDYQELFPEYPK
jgi:membrane protein implicated in regulation of membrane protease activity